MDSQVVAEISGRIIARRSLSIVCCSGGALRVSLAFVVSCVLVLALGAGRAAAQSAVSAGPALRLDGGSRAATSPAPLAGRRDKTFSLEFRGGTGAIALHPLAAGVFKSGMSPLIGASFGLRLTPALQLDAGMDLVGRALGAAGSINTTGGTRDISDAETFFRLGARGTLPLAHGRLQLAAGGGYVHAHYTEYAVLGNETLSGYEGNSRGGNGAYEFAQVAYKPSAQRGWTFGVRVGWDQVKTDGEIVGELFNPVVGTRATGFVYVHDIAGYRVTTKDRWSSFAGVVGFEF